MQRSSRLLAALLVFALIQNGAWAAPHAPDPAEGDAAPAHHAHDGLSKSDSGQKTADPGAKDCCDTGSCDCGCTSNGPAAVFRPAPTAHDWARIAAVRAVDAAGELPGFGTTPFRPPA